MKSVKSPDIICRLKEIRNKKNFTQTQLADLVGLKRQAIYDMEAGRYLPNTSVALRLARVLDTSVEDIFYEKLQEHQPVALVDEQTITDPRVSIAKIRDKLYAYSLSGKNSIMEEMKAADGLLAPGNNRVMILKSNEQLENTALLLGCDPAFSILGHHVHKNRTDAALHCRFASSKKSICQLADGYTHIAGIHMHDTGSIDGNQEFIRKGLKNFKGLLVAFAFFEEGLMVARGNPFDIRKPSDLAQDGICFVNREKGAALRTLLDDCLLKSNIPFSAIHDYNDIVNTHSQGALKIIHGICDVALGLRAVATAFDLDFVPITRVRCDLVIPHDFLIHTGVKTALDTMQKSSFRNELSCLPGYDASCTGKIIAKF
ncbi:substrate-binding domain-containing protein [Desulfobacula toluolica]|uniref:ModR: transcriptional regulator of molybdate metabolism, Xre family n=1 Tax=Desulfobacula toluolica (strain DSM 7467 / Tol2) TaxID=651182 RepID=K0NP40_DESTT|nr:substrate-binding domain-containing protein [Desulfobacula toluolica]CCK82450.1 ModR: transcriptional regulator of molybdate metabolism, Xre family [Desulfobacula toluolica Tol2]